MNSRIPLECQNKGQSSVKKIALQLQECTKKADIISGRCVYDHILKVSLESNAFLGTRLIWLFTSCGFISDANQAFQKILEPNVYAWGAIISANFKLGNYKDAIKLYNMMHDLNVRPDNHIFVASFKACANSHALKDGQLMHHDIVEMYPELDGYVASSLIYFYAHCGSLDDACKLFDVLHRPDKVTFGVMMSAYTQHGHCEEAITLYKRMLCMNVKMDQVAFLCTLRACAGMSALESIRLVHDHIANCTFESDEYIGNVLVDAYAKCGSIDDAHKVFCSLEKCDVVAWGAMIEGLVQNADCEEALRLFNKMQQEMITPDRVVTISVLKACCNESLFYDGKIIHYFAILNRFESDPLINNSVIDMYAKCGSLDDARRVFDSLSYHNIVMWNTVINGYIHHGCVWEAITLFQAMIQQGIRPNQVTFLCILKICSILIDLQRGMVTHAYVVEMGFELDNSVNNTLTDMYAKCGSFNYAHDMFEQSSKLDLVTWGVIISGFVQHRHFEEAYLCFGKMFGKGLYADEAVFISVLKSCCSMGDLSLGKLIHCNIIESNCELDVYVGNTLIDLYGKCGSFEDANAVFEAFKERNVITFNVMIAACLQYNKFQECLQLFHKLGEANILPTVITFICILTVCTEILAFDYGKLIHSHIIEVGLHLDVYIGNALVDMYGKCDSLEDAFRIFEKCRSRDVVTWNAIIATCAQKNLYTVAIDYFEKMQESGMNPDEATFLSVLSACSHAGQVEKGHYLMKQMTTQYGLVPTLDHYSCMLDLLSRAGLLNEAVDFLDSTPCETNIEGWTSLLAHCKENGNVTLGKQCFGHLFEADQAHSIGISY